MTADQIELQLGDDLANAVHALAALAGPLAALEWPELLRARSAEVVDRLRTEDGDKACRMVMKALWPNCDPELAGHPQWWSTPLGMACARGMGRPDSPTVTYATAAEMLGVAIGTVKTLAHRGTIEKHPDGGLSRESVLARLAVQKGDPGPKWTFEVEGPGPIGGYYTPKEHWSRADQVAQWLARALYDFGVLNGDRDTETDRRSATLSPLIEQVTGVRTWTEGRHQVTVIRVYPSAKDPVHLGGAMSLRREVRAQQRQRAEERAGRAHAQEMTG